MNDNGLGDNETPLVMERSRVQSSLAAPAFPDSAKPQRFASLRSPGALANDAPCRNALQPPVHYPLAPEPAATD